MMGPVFEELKKDFEGKIKFESVNVDENVDTATKYQVMSVPTLVLERDGTEVERKVGAMPKGTIESWLNSYL